MLKPAELWKTEAGNAFPDAESFLASLYCSLEVRFDPILLFCTRPRRLS